MKLLITGGAGFIGSNFIRYWLDSHLGDEILNFDKLTYAGNLDNLQDLTGQKYADRHTFVKGDICDPEAVDRAMKGIEAVVNFAAESHVDRSILEPAPFVRTNVAGTQVLLGAALKHKVRRFHHISTDEVFGSLPLTSRAKFDEQSPYQPSSPYAASKAASDHLVRAYHKTYGLPITITNCSNNYGPYQFPEKFISLAITNLLEGKKIPIYTPGNQVRDWLFVKDHCRAIDLVLRRGKPGETYCVGGMTEEISNLEIARSIARLMGKTEDEIELIPDRPGHDARYAINWRKIQAELGWKPEVDLGEGLKQTIAWYKARETWWKGLKGKNKRYYKKQYGRV